LNMRNTMPLSSRTFGNKKVITRSTKISNFIYETLNKKKWIGKPYSDLRFYIQDFPACSIPEGLVRYIIPNKINAKYIRIPLCFDCITNDKCAGILKAYADMYGIDEFRLKHPASIFASPNVNQSGDDSTRNHHIKAENNVGFGEMKRGFIPTRLKTP